jgi:hypothetical protein
MLAVIHCALKRGTSERVLINTHVRVCEPLQKELA